MAKLGPLLAAGAVVALAALPKQSVCGSSERARASEAFAYLAQVEAMQQRFRARTGHFADSLDQLEPGLTQPKYFRVWELHGVAENDNWTVQLERWPPSEEAGAYRVVWTSAGFDSLNSDLPQRLIPIF